MRPAVEIVLGNPANAGLRRLREARPRRPGRPALEFPEAVDRPYETLGTHPDLVARLWDELGGVLPVDCRAIFYDSPVLIHPGTGVVFGLAGGTHAYALRLPEEERALAIRAGAPRIIHYPGGSAFDLSDIGPEWVFGGWYRDEETWCRAAYSFAGGAPATGIR